MTALRSALYVGKVAHHRLRPRTHSLAYNVFYLLLDLDEVEQLANSSHLFWLGPAGLISYDSRDHGDGSDTPLRDQVETHLRAAGLSPDGGPIRLLTLPRILGYLFNPISVYFCHHRNGELFAVLYEVTNTFRDRHSYLIPVDSPDRPIVQRSGKALYVSPFLDIDGMHYTFRLSPPETQRDTQLALDVTAHDRQGPMVVGTLEMRRRDLTDRSLARVLLTFPLMTLKVTAAIHWEALRLWLKGIAVRRHPVPPAHPVTVGCSVRPAKALRREDHNVAA